MNAGMMNIVMMRCDVCDFLFLINSPATKASKAVAQMQSELKR